MVGTGSGRPCLSVARLGWAPSETHIPRRSPWAAKDGGWRPVREQEPADARGMPPAPLPPVTQFFIVGGLAVPAPLPADHKLGIRGLAPAERGGRDRASSLSARCRPRSRLEFLVSSPPTPGQGEGETRPARWAASLRGALEGARRAGGGVTVLLLAGAPWCLSGPLFPGLSSGRVTS